MSGRIDFEPERPRLLRATVHVWIEDTTYAGAPARRVAERSLVDVSYDGDPDGLPFTIDWDDEPSLPASHTYSVAAFIDLDGDGRPGPGDYVCDRAASARRSGEARVHVRRIV